MSDDEKQLVLNAFAAHGNNAVQIIVFCKTNAVPNGPVWNIYNHLRTQQQLLRRVRAILRAQANGLPIALRKNTVLSSMPMFTIALHRACGQTL